MSKHGFAFELAQYAARNPQNLVAAMIDNWVDKTTKLLLFELQNPSRCFRIKYESLVFNPAEAIPRLFYFLNVAREPDILDRVFQTHHDQGGGDPKVIFTKKINSQYVGRGSAILLHFIPLEHLQRMNSLLKQLDYPQVGPDWDTSPSPYRPNNGSTETTQLLTTVREVFQTHVPARLRLNAELLKSTKASFRFVITGSQPCCWFVNLEGSHSQVIEGDHAADCTITTEDDVILGIANERLNAVTAYMDGKIKIQGRLELATMVGIIL
jgi:putative sterol carrier protein